MDIIMEKNTPEFTNELFILLLNGNLKDIQLFVHSHTLSDINICGMINLSCFYNHLHVAQWMESLFPSYFWNCPIQAIQRVFSVACMNGYLDVAKWLLLSSSNTSNTIDISYDNYIAYRLAKQYNQTHVTEWLETDPLTEEKIFYYRFPYDDYRLFKCMIK